MTLNDSIFYRLVYFTGNLDTPMENHLYVLSLDEPISSVSRLTQSVSYGNVGPPYPSPAPLKPCEDRRKTNCGNIRREEQLAKNDVNSLIMQFPSHPPFPGLFSYGHDGSKFFVVHFGEFKDKFGKKKKFSQILKSLA